METRSSSTPKTSPALGSVGIIYDQLIEGHEVCVGDFNGDGRDDIVAGDRARARSQALTSSTPRTTPGPIGITKCSTILGCPLRDVR